MAIIDETDSAGTGDSTIGFKVLYEDTANEFLNLQFVDELELDVEGKTHVMTDMCGDSEARKNGDNNWTMNIEGVAPLSKIDKLKTLGRSGDVWMIQSNIHNMNGVFKNMTITDIDSEVTIDYVDKDGNLQNDFIVSYHGKIKESSSN